MIEVTAVAGIVTVQDTGRPGWMHQGIATGGALVPESLARANLAAGNSADAAALEVVGNVTVRARGDHVVATDEGLAHALADGAAFVVSSGSARVTYLAVRGGIDVPVVLGSRSTLLVAALGGHLGRVLRRGDTLPTGPCVAAPVAKLPARPDRDAAIRIVPGPDLDAFAQGGIDVLLASAFTVSPRSDRVGARLIGPALPRASHDAGVSAPMVRGALQVPAGGEPIVLGPDHPTTGGYPVLATVLRVDIGALMARPVGCAVRFALAAAIGGK